MNKMTRKFNPVLLTTLIAITATLSISQANAVERGGFRGENAGFNRIDVNQDGELSLDELTAPALSKVEKKLIQKDTDEDALISFEEFQQTRNGALTDLSDIAEDIIQCVADVKADTNNDDIVVPSADKFMSPTDKFAEIDSSEDDFISLEELQARVITKAAASFLIMDLDADGFVSEDEFNTTKAKFRATKGTVHQCIDELSTDDIV